MPQKKFSLEPGGPPRLEVSWRGGFKDLSVSLDGVFLESQKALLNPQRTIRAMQRSSRGGYLE